MKFFKAFYITGFTSIIVTIFAFFTNVIVTRYLGPEGRGNYSIVSNLILVLTLVLGEGIRRNNVILIGNKSSSIKNVFSKNLIYFLSLLVPSYILVMMFPSVFEKFMKVNYDYIIIGVTAALLGILWKGLQAIFLGLQDYKNYNLVLLIYTIGIFIINISIVYIFNLGIFAILNTFIVISFIVIVYEIFLIYRISDNSQKYKDSNENGKLILHATVSSIAVFIMLRGDIFYLNYYSDLNTTGIYSLTKVFVDLFQKLPFVLGPIIIARSASLNIEKEVSNIAKLSRVLILINVITIIFTYLFGDYIIKILFTSKFLDAYNYLLLILPSMLIFSSGHIINAFLMGQGFPNVVVINSVFFGLLNFIFNIVLIPKFGVVATPIISCVTFALWSFVFLLYFSWKYNFSFFELVFVKKTDLNYFIKFGK